MTAVTKLELKNVLAQTKDEQKYKDFPIEFPQPFGELPAGVTDKVIVIGTVELVKNDTDDVYVMNVSNITAKGFIARVAKVYGTSDTWAKLQLNYSAHRETLYGGQ